MIYGISGRPVKRFKSLILAISVSSNSLACKVNRDSSIQDDSQTLGTTNSPEDVAKRWNIQAKFLQTLDLGQNQCQNIAVCYLQSQLPHMFDHTQPTTSADKEVHSEFAVPSDIAQDQSKSVIWLRNVIKESLSASHRNLIEKTHPGMDGSERWMVIAQLPRVIGKQGEQFVKLILEKPKTAVQMGITTLLALVTAYPIAYLPQNNFMLADQAGGYPGRNSIDGLCAQPQPLPTIIRQLYGEKSGVYLAAKDTLDDNHIYCLTERPGSQSGLGMTKCSRTGTSQLWNVFRVSDDPSAKVICAKNNSGKCLYLGQKNARISLGGFDVRGSTLSTKSPNHDPNFLFDFNTTTGQIKAKGPGLNGQCLDIYQNGSNDVGLFDCDASKWNQRWKYLTPSELKNHIHDEL